MQSKLKNNIKALECSETDILVELNRILSSDLFSRSSVLSKFLKFIVEETIACRTEELKEYTIAVSALGKSTDFNPQIDAIVRIHAGRLRRLLKEYYASSGKTDAIKIELVSGTYVPVFRNHLTSKQKDTAANIVQPISYSRTKLTLAVLPFRNLCPTNEYQFFVDGFGEEMTRIFSKFQSIDVIAHHSARKYASALEDIRMIGTDLGVHYLINGSVKRSSEEIIVNVGLIEVLKGRQVWSQTYNHALNIDNLMDIQNKITESVYSILGGYYGFLIHENYNTRRTSNLTLDSFDAALWNYYFHMNYSKDAYIKTRQALENAVANDPEYALGLAMLSGLYLDGYSLGYPTIEDPVGEAYRIAKKAIAIDPQCQHAHQEYAWANLHMKRKEEAIKSMEYCLALNPSSVSSKGTVGFGMACAGEYKRAHELLTQSLELNPHCPWWFYFGFFLVHYQNKEYSMALQYANKIEASDVFLNPLAKATAKAQLGLTSEALEDINVLKEKHPMVLDNLPMYLNSFLLDTDIIDDLVCGVNKSLGS